MHNDPSTKRHQFWQQIRSRHLHNRFATIRSLYSHQPLEQQSQGSNVHVHEMKELMTRLHRNKEHAEWQAIVDTVRECVARQVQWGALWGCMDGVLDLVCGDVDDPGQWPQEQQHADISPPKPAMPGQLVLQCISLGLQVLQRLPCPAPAGARPQLLYLLHHGLCVLLSQAPCHSLPLLCRCMDLFLQCCQPDTHNPALPQFLLSLGLQTKIVSVIEYLLEESNRLQAQLLSLATTACHQQQQQVQGVSLLGLHHHITALIRIVYPSEQDNIQLHYQFMIDYQPKQQSNEGETNLAEHLLCYGIYLLQKLEPYLNKETMDGQDGRLRSIVAGVLGMLGCVLEGHAGLAGRLGEEQYCRAIVGVLSGSTCQEVLGCTLRLLTCIAASQPCHAESLIHDHCLLDRLLPLLGTHHLIPTLVPLLVCLLHCRPKPTKLVLLSHPLLPHLLGHLQSQLPFYLPIFQLFPYYFLCFGRKATLSTMPLFLECLAREDVWNGHSTDMARLRQIAGWVLRNGQVCLAEGDYHCMRGMYEEYGMGAMLDYEDMTE